MGCHFLLYGNLPDPGIKPTSLASCALAGRLFTTVTLGSPILAEQGMENERSETGVWVTSQMAIFQVRGDDGLLRMRKVSLNWITAPAFMTVAHKVADRVGAYLWQTNPCRKTISWPLKTWKKSEYLWPLSSCIKGPNSSKEHWTRKQMCISLRWINGNWTLSKLEQPWEKIIGPDQKPSKYEICRVFFLSYQI